MDARMSKRELENAMAKKMMIGRSCRTTPLKPLGRSACAAPPAAAPFACRVRTRVVRNPFGPKEAVNTEGELELWDNGEG